MSSVITYLFFGVLWNVTLDILATIMESDNRLNNRERIFSILFWPITFCVFGYEFIKTYFQR